MLPALLKYESALRNPQIPPKAIVRMVKDAKVTEADVNAARAELAAKVVETVADAVAKVAPPIVEALAEIVEQAGGPNVDADTARANLEQAGAVVVEVAEAVAHSVDIVVASGSRIPARKAIELIFAVLGVTDADGDGDVDALDALNAVLAAITKRPGRGVVVESAVPGRVPGAAVRALRTERIVDSAGKPWRVSFRDVYSGEQADFLASKHPALVEPFPAKR